MLWYKCKPAQKQNSGLYHLRMNSAILHVTHVSKIVNDLEADFFIYCSKNIVQTVFEKHTTSEGSLKQTTSSWLR